MKRVLQLTNKPPWPPVEGGPMAMLAITQGLLEKGYSVKVLSISTHKFRTDLTDMPQYLQKETGFETLFIDTRVRPWPALLNLLSNESYHISRFYDPDFAHRLAEILTENRFNYVIMESLFMLPYLEVIRNCCHDLPVILRAHNIEHRIWQRIAAGEKNPVKRLYLRHLTTKLRLAEIRAVSRFDAVVPITDVDASWFRNIAQDIPCMALPFGTETDDREVHLPPFPPLRLYHLGSMDWWPNIEAVRWLLQELWPKCGELYNQVELHLAGRNMSRKLSERKMKDVVVHGEIPDSKSFINEHHVLIAPLFSGSGIRIKILEAMALGKVVLTTSIGAEGINCTHGKNILIANDADAFVHVTRLLLDDPQKITGIGREAKKLVREQYSPSLLANKLADFLETTVIRRDQSESLT